MPRIFGDFAINLCDCSALPTQGGARQLIELIQRQGGTFLRSGKPDPDPFQRINSRGDIMATGLRHELLPYGGPIGVGFSFGQDMRWVSVSCDISFIDPQKVDTSASSFLRFAELIYPHLGPAYGWVDEVGTRLPKEEDVAARKLKYTFWANFFGPPYVERYGRDFLLGAPGWRVEELSDGGILYVLSPSFVNLWQVVRENEVLGYFRRRIPGVRPYRRVRDKFLE